jgi:tetratricopeptide (TPR) repeat protein
LDSKVNVPTGNIDFKPVQAAFQQNDIPKAAALLTEMEKAYPQNPVIHGLWGMLELSRKNFVAARQRADTALKIAPDYALGHVILGNLSLIEKKWLEAETRFLLLTQKQPDLYEAWQGLALARNGLGNSALAEQAAQKMHDLQPGNFEALRLVVLYHSNRGDIVGALALIDETLKQKPDLASARSLRVNLLDSNGQTKEALEEVDVLIAQNPNIPLLVAQRSRLLARLGRLAEAEQAATTAINASPNDYGTNEEAGQAYALCQKFPEAIASHLKCVELKPEEASAHQKLGYTYWLAGNKDRARASLERAVELSPKYLMGWKTLATICEDTGDTARLAQCQAKIMELEAKPSPSTP